MKIHHLRRCRASFSLRRAWGTPALWGKPSALHLGHFDRPFRRFGKWGLGFEDLDLEIFEGVFVRSFKVNSQLLPVGFPREFDAHIYFSESQREAAERLREAAIEQFQGRVFFVGEMIPEPIGPHPLPMFEINFPKELFAEVVHWLMHFRGKLSVLVHELTGDDLYDHTQAALWLGSAVSLDLSRFSTKN